MKISHRRAIGAGIWVLALLQHAGSYSASAATAEHHVRGVVQSINDQTLAIKTENGSVYVQLSSSTALATVSKHDRQCIKEGSVVGVISATHQDGSQFALAVHVSPDGLPRPAEGVYPWAVTEERPGRGLTRDPGRTFEITNGTVTSFTVANQAAPYEGGMLTVAYTTGAIRRSRVIAVPHGIPVVTLEPAQREDLHRNVHVFVVAQRTSDGTLVADRVVAGRNGVVPPM